MSSPYRRIGQGFCGTVWAPASTSPSSHALKREDGGPGRSLHNDYQMHLTALQSLHTQPTKIYIPSCHAYITPSDKTWWTEHLPLFPPEYRHPCNILLTERIPPFPRTVRETLMDKYCPEALKAPIRCSEPDADCLIRPYLGRRRRRRSVSETQHSKFQAFSLRNYPLHIDQMEELGLDRAKYAKTMAETLAVLYWEAHIDANDVEFVLAPAPAPAPRDKEQLVDSEEISTHDSSTIIKSQNLGDHVVWLLDFDCCKPMALDKKGVEQAVAAFYKNDPYYPRPGSGNLNDRALWAAFKEIFLSTSSAILEAGSVEAGLPALWIDMVEQREKL